MARLGCCSVPGTQWGGTAPDVCSQGLGLRPVAHLTLCPLSSEEDDFARELGVKSLGYSQHWLATQMENLGYWEARRGGLNFPVRGG